MKKEAMEAKRAGTKPEEGRLASGRTRGLAEGSMIMYMCGRPFRYRITKTPQTHESVAEGIGVVGWESLMPWAGSSDECLRLYAEMFAKKPMTLTTARKWDTQNTVPFVTWADTPVQEQTLKVCGYLVGNVQG